MRSPADLNPDDEAKLRDRLARLPIPALPEDDKALPQRELVVCWRCRHYVDASEIVLWGDAGERLCSYCIGKPSL